ncbi:isochorismate synthase, partial [Streptomyces parvus]|nr:isochorismate synthase [Streptomyces parvus]
MSTASQVATHTAPADPAHPAVGAATSLLDAYAPGDHFLATPGRTLHARGPGRHVPHDERPLTARVDETLAAAVAAGQESPVVIGAIPFDHTAPAALSVPESVRAAPPLASDPLIALPAAAPAAGAWEIRQVPEPEIYGKGVASAVERMWRGEFSKVVLARTLELTSEAPLDLPAML